MFFVDNKLSKRAVSYSFLWKMEENIHSVAVWLLQVNRLCLIGIIVVFPHSILFNIWILASSKVIGIQAAISWITHFEWCLHILKTQKSNISSIIYLWRTLGRKTPICWASQDINGIYSKIDQINKKVSHESNTLIFWA